MEDILDAAKRGPAEVKALIEANADVNAKDKVSAAHPTHAHARTRPALAPAAARRPAVPSAHTRSVGMLGRRSAAARPS